MEENVFYLNNQRYQILFSENIFSARIEGGVMTISEFRKILFNIEKSVVALLGEEDPDDYSGWAVSNKVRKSSVKVFLTGLSKNSPEVVEFIIAYASPIAMQLILNYDGVKLFVNDLENLINDKLIGKKTKKSRKQKALPKVDIHVKKGRKVRVYENTDGSTDIQIY